MAIPLVSEVGAFWSHEDDYDVCVCADRTTQRVAPAKREVNQRNATKRTTLMRPRPNECSSTPSAHCAADTSDRITNHCEFERETRNYSATKFV